MRILAFVRLGGLFALWLAMTLLALRSHLNDPFDPSREGTARYGHNNPGDFNLFLIVTLVELVILVLLLRPWSYHRSWRRALGALVLYFFWTLISLIISMHAGGVIALHALWLICLDLVLLVGLLWSVIASRAKPS